MAALKFVDSHNMVAYLERPTNSDDFTKIVDFLNANPIRYALTVSPTIYVSCIEQFWSTAKAQTINEETQIHALVDGKKIVITESSVRRDLQFADEDGTDCLPTTTIFENLKLMGYENLSDKLTFFKSYFSHQWKFLVHTILQCLSPKKTAWNEFSSNIASAIICLATNQKFNFSKMVFDGMTRNLDSLSAKFLMYPRFLQVFLDKQLDKVPSHNAVYNAPCHTKKVFANMKRIRKDFLGKVTPLFDTMLIQHQSEEGDSLERAATTGSSLEAKQVSGNITKTRSKATLNEPTHQGTGSGSGLRRQDTMGDTIDLFENVSKTSYDSPLGGVNTPRSDKDTMQLKELMEICTNLLQRVQDLETTKTAQAKEITSLKKRVKKLEQRGRSRTTGLKRLYKVGTSRMVESSTKASLGDQEDASKHGRNIAEIDADIDISLVHEDVGIQGRFHEEDMFDTSVFNDEEVFVGQDMADQEVNVAEKEVSAADPVTTAGEVVTTASVDISTASVPITVSTATPTTPPTTTTEDDMTLAETLMEIKSAKPKAIGVVMQEPSEIPRISAAQQQIQEKAQGSRDKGKAKMVEEEEPKEPTKIKDQIKHDEELAQRLDAQLQAEMEKEDRLARQREEEDNIVSWDNAQAMMEADYQMAERLHAEEQASLTDEEKASLFVQLLDARKKHFAALRAQEIRNKPPTKMQKRTTMCNYLKNMAGYKHNQLRHKSFDDIQKLFDKALKRVNTFVPMDTEKVEGSKAKAAGSETRVEESSKRAGEELDRESTKKQKVEDETEQAELKECFEIIPFDEDSVNTIPLATKQAPIVDYKITRDARKIYYHITRADGSTKVYMRFEDMLKMFDREDLEVLYRIVKDRFKSTKPVGDNRVLWGNLMTMFEPSAGDEMWREQGRYLIKSWKLIDSCRVHCLMLESMYIYMLVEEVFSGTFTYRSMWEGKATSCFKCEWLLSFSLSFIKKTA
ncbi:hypothetical protein Tco_0149946 [Tanacetum coccineum]